MNIKQAWVKALDEIPDFNMCYDGFRKMIIRMNKGQPKTIIQAGEFDQIRKHIETKIKYPKLNQLKAQNKKALLDHLVKEKKTFVSGKELTRLVAIYDAMSISTLRLRAIAVTGIFKANQEFTHQQIVSILYPGKNLESS